MNKQAISQDPQEWSLKWISPITSDEEIFGHDQTDEQIADWTFTAIERAPKCQQESMDVARTAPRIIWESQSW